MPHHPPVSLQREVEVVGVAVVGRCLTANSGSKVTKGDGEGSGSAPDQAHVLLLLLLSALD